MPFSGTPRTCDPSTIRSYSTGLGAIAVLIAGQVGVLRRLADPGDWEAETADAFRDQANDLAEEITLTEGRFRQVGGLVNGWADAIEQARRQAGLFRDQAQTQQHIVDANLKAGPEPVPTDAAAGAVPTMSAAGEAQNARRENARSEIERLRGELDGLLGRHEEDGTSTGEQIRGALNDGLYDGWRDRLKSWIAGHVELLRSVATWTGRIAAVVGRLALMISPVGWVALAAALVALAASTALASTGDGSWFDVGLHAVGALTFGAGACLTRGVSTAFRGGRALWPRGPATTRAQES